MIDKLRKKIFWSILATAMLVLTVIVVSYDAMQFYQSQQEKEQMLSVVLNEVTSGGYSSFGNSYDSADADDDWNGGESGKEQTDGKPDMNGPRGGKGGPGGKGGKGRGHRSYAHIVDSLVSDEVSIVQLDSSGSVTEASGFFNDMDQEEQDAVVKALNEKGLPEWSGTDGEEGVVCDSKGTVRGMSYMAKIDSSGSYVVMTDAKPDEDVLILIGMSALGLIIAFGLFALIAKRLSAAIVRPVEESMQKQKQFVADASHELKTPVAVISANAEVLEKEVGGNKWLGYIKQESGRMTELVNQLLQLSKIDYDGEHGASEAVRFDAAEAAMEAALPFESIAYEQGARYKIKAPKTLAALGRPDDVKQIVGVLLDNAFKHVDRGGLVTLEVLGGGNIGSQDAESGAADVRSGYRDGILIRVSNTGKTIPPDVLPHLFDRFYKEDQAREYSSGSFGLGLAIAKALVERNGGEIRAESFDGNTTFEVKLT